MKSYIFGLMIITQIGPIHCVDPKKTGMCEGLIHFDRTTGKFAEKVKLNKKKQKDIFRIMFNCMQGEIYYNPKTDSLILRDKIEKTKSSKRPELKHTKLQLKCLVQTQQVNKT